MHEICVLLKPTGLQHKVYVFSQDSVNTPAFITDATIDEIPSVVAMNAAKYQIYNIKIAGPHDYTARFKDLIAAKFSTCFGEKADQFSIELV